jgi:lipoprotein Spr
MNYAERARSLTGCRFRPQGRIAEYGLDCLGLAAITYNVAIERVPADYRLRGRNLFALLEGLKPYFRPVAVTRVASGDLLLFDAGRDQVHLGVKTADGFVHAHARLGVFETPGDPPWPTLRAYRRRRAG